MPLVKSAVLLVITGTRLPIRTLAFSLLRARMRGLASVLVLPSVCSAFAEMLIGVMPRVCAFWCRRSATTRDEPPVVAAAAAPVEVAVTVAELGE